MISIYGERDLKHLLQPPPPRRCSSPARKVRLSADMRFSIIVSGPTDGRGALGRGAAPAAIGGSGGSRRYVRGGKPGTWNRLPCRKRTWLIVSRAWPLRVRGAGGRLRGRRAEMWPP